MISIIIPVYNTENYLRRCIDSVINQTYRDIEIILVDDGSTDNSPEICDNYTKIDKRVSVVHQENKGLSAARNTGIKCAKAEEIAFVDSDDFIHIRMIETLHQLLISEKADMAACGYYWVREGERIVDEVDGRFNANKTYNRDCHAFLFERPDLAVIACNKLFKKKLFDRVGFPEGRYHEDEFVVHHLLGECDCVSYTERKLYFYIKHDGSITGVLSQKRIMDTIDAFGDRVDYYRDNGMYDYYGIAGRNWIGYLIESHRKYLDFAKTDYRDVFLRNIRKRMRERLPEFRRNRIIKFRYYFVCTIWIKMPRVGDGLLRIYNSFHCIKEQ